jgi:hypothetical protein|tara:strand:+ start:294 stop:575 length:282 start_codon:yes stop_codon:yes gene_type:complete
MGRVKEQLLNEYEFTNDMVTADYAYQHELWQKSKEYVNMVNDELIDTQSIYSKSNIDEAVCYAFKGVDVSQSEVGSDVYSKLIYGKIKEYLNK